MNASSNLNKIKKPSFNLLLLFQLLNLRKIGKFLIGKFLEKEEYAKTLNYTQSSSFTKINFNFQKVKDKYIKAVNIAQMKEKMSVLKMKVDKIKVCVFTYYLRMIKFK